MLEVNTFLDFATRFALVLLSISFLIIIWRIIIGPTLPDRILALDMLVTVGIGFIAVIGIKTGFYLYMDIALALGLVGFLATVALARFVMNKATTYGRVEPDTDDATNQKGTVS